ncbi:MAG: cysteate synthase [Colwellia sp.]|nr:cysteate synthase [Colwellia sp.]
MKNKYILNCVKCNWTSGEFHLLCPNCQKNSFLRTSYNNRNIKKGISKFSDFIDYLPISKIHDTDFDPQIGLIKSSKIAKSLGLKNLYILFSGHWPEMDAHNISGSFKALEAICILEKIAETGETLILSSAGNAGKAAVQFSIIFNYKAVVVIPENAVSTINVLNQEQKRNTFLIAVRNGFYYEAIKTVDKIVSNVPNLIREGGVYNVARRDALGIPFLRACLGMGRIPDHYFQAIGSGTGAIAAWEGRRRLIDNKVFQEKHMRLRLSQNYPFCPIGQSWETGKRDYIGYSTDEYQKRLKQVVATVLSNNTPPYSVYGGLYDVLSNTNGTVDSIPGKDVLIEMEKFQQVKGIDIDPAAGVAIASLKKAVSNGSVRPEETVLLHVTGGGYSRIFRDYNLTRYEPDIYVTYGGDMKDLYKRLVEFI